MEHSQRELIVNVKVNFYEHVHWFRKRVRQLLNDE